MGEHVRRSIGRTRRVGGAGLAALTLVLLGGGIWLLRPEAAVPTTTTQPPNLAAPSSSTTTTTTVPEPVTHPYGGDAVIGIGSEPFSLNPFLDGGNSDVVRTIGRPVWAGAFTLDGRTLDPVPVLAAELPTLDNGGLVVDADGTVSVVYRVNPEARWENGTPVTGDDFAFTYRLVTDPALPIREDVREPYRQIVPGSLATGRDRVAFELVGPSLAYLEVFSVVLPVHQVEGTDFATDWNERMWWSAGPFRFDRWRSGREIVLRRNDGYWVRDPVTGQELPYLDRLVFSVAGDAAAVTAGFTSGRFDVVALPADPAVVDEVRSMDGVDVQVRWGPTWEHLSFQFGPGRFDRNPESVNEYLEYRKAVVYTVDRAAVAEAVYGDLVPSFDSPLGIAWPSIESTGWSSYRPDPARAAEWLADLDEVSGVSKPVGVLTSNLTAERTASLAVLAATFGASPISLQIESPEETGVFFLETVGPGTFDLAEWAWVPGTGPAHAVADLRRWFVELPEDGGSNFSRWGSAGSGGQGEGVDRLSALLDEIAVEMDLGRLRVLLGEAEQLLADLVVTIPLYPELNAAAVWTGEIGGYDHSVLPGGDTWNAALWYRGDG